MKILKSLLPLALAMASVSAASESDQFAAGSEAAQTPELKIISVTESSVIEERESICRELVTTRRRVHERYRPAPQSTDHGQSSAGLKRVGAELLGGAAGGLLGSQIGKGNGKVASAAGGALIGAIVGNRLSSSGQEAERSHTPPREVWVYDEQHRDVPCVREYSVPGHTVTYRIGESRFQTFVPSAPLPRAHRY